MTRGAAVVAAPFSGEWLVFLTSAAGAAWTAAFALFVIKYGPKLILR